MYTKKRVAKAFAAEIEAELAIVGVRQAEHGKRATAFKSCYSPAVSDIAQFRPIFYFTDEDKRMYEDFCNVTHSDCYTVYGLHRTGCVGCPFGSQFEHELDVVKQYEPNLYQAANAIFGQSYDYTRKYRAFRDDFKQTRSRGDDVK